MQSFLIIFSMQFSLNFCYATCNAGYIKADEVEKVVWDYIRNLIIEPSNVLEVLKDIEKTNNDNTLPTIEKKINSIRKRLKSYPRRIKDCHDLLLNEDYTLPNIYLEKVELDD